MVRSHRSATATVLESASGYCEKARLDLVGRFEIEVVAGKTQPVLIIHRLARLDAEQEFVGLMLLPATGNGSHWWRRWGHYNDGTDR